MHHPLTIKDEIWLPQTKEKFDHLMDSLMEIMKLERRDDYDEAIAGFIMHLPHEVAFLSVERFVNNLKNRIACQVSYEVIDSIRVKAKEAKLKEQQEVTNQAAAPAEASGDTIVESPQESPATGPQVP